MGVYMVVWSDVIFILRNLLFMWKNLLFRPTALLLPWQRPPLLHYSTPRLCHIIAPPRQIIVLLKTIGSSLIHSLFRIIFRRLWWLSPILCRTYPIHSRFVYLCNHFLFGYASSNLLGAILSLVWNGNICGAYLVRDRFFIKWSLAQFL